MRRELHVRFCEGGGVKLPSATRLVVLCRSRAAAVEARRRMEILLTRLRLTLHPEKTRWVDLSGGKEGFDFLGFHHRRRRGWRDPSRLVLRQWPSTRAVKAIRAKVKARTSSRSTLCRTSQEVVADLNRILRGWLAYFGCAGSSHRLSALRAYVHERLALWDAKKRRRRSRRYFVADHEARWYNSLGVVALRVRSTEARN